MSLVLGAGAFCNWDKALPVLTALGFNEGQARAVGVKLRQAVTNQQSTVVEGAAGLELLSEELQNYPNQYVILLYSDLAAVLTQAISVDCSIADSIKEWDHSLTVLQNFYRKHRKQTLLFNLQEVLEQPQLFLEVCANEWDYAVGTGDISLEANKVESWSQLLASELLKQNEELSHTLQHTKAMTWPLGVSEETELDSQSHSGTLDLLGLLQSSVTTHKDLEEQKISNRKLTEENQLILDKLCLVQEELEQQVLAVRSEQGELKTLRDNYTQLESEKNKLNATVNDSQAQLKKSCSEIESLQKDNKDLSEENQLILDKLFLTQEELEKQLLTLRSKQEQLEKSRSEIDLLQKDNKNLAKEHHLILNGFHTLQKEFEQQFLKSKAEVEEFKTLFTKYTELDSEKGKLNAAVSDLQAQLKASNDQIELLQKDKKILSEENQFSQEELEKQLARLRSEQVEYKTLRTKYTELNSEKGKLNTVLSDLQAQFKESNAQIALLQKDKKMLSEENQLVLDELHLTQKALEKQLLKSQTSQNDLKTLRTNYTQIEKELEKQILEAKTRYSFN